MVLAPSSSLLPKLLLKPGRWTVGSAATCSYRISAAGVQPRHALVVCGGQTTILKAWDANTWHNGLPLSGEVRLQAGDTVTLGSVEFSIEADDNLIDVAPIVTDLPNANDQHDAPASGSDHSLSDQLLSRHASIGTASCGISEKQSDGWDLENLRSQIQELRDELSQNVMRRGRAVAVASTPITHHEQHAEQNSARAAELEQLAAAAQNLAEQTQHELAATREEHARREADLRQIVDELRPALEIAQQEAAELRNVRETLRSEASQRVQAWEQQNAEWSIEREQWQEELISLANTRQQEARDWEQQQATMIADATRWKAEGEQLRTAWQQQQTAWESERSQTQDDLRRQMEAAQQTLQAATRREQELADQALQLDADRQQFDADCQQFDTDRQELQGEQCERDQAATVLAEERQRVEQQAADVAAKSEEFARRVAEFEQQLATLTRDQQTLEHSWNWLQSDRRKLVVEKEEWQQRQAQWQAEQERGFDERQCLQRERDEFAKARDLWQEQHAAAEQFTVEREQLVAQRQQLQADESALAVQREQLENERRIATDELEAARHELRSQQQALRDEVELRQLLTIEQETLSTEREPDQQPLMDDGPEASFKPVSREEAAASWLNTSRSDADGDWAKDVSSTPQQMPFDASLMEESPSPLSDAWSIGVDLTAPRETHAVDRDFEPEAASDWAPANTISPIDEATSQMELPQPEATSTTPPDIDKEAEILSISANDSNLDQPPEPDTTPDKNTADSRAKEAEIVPSTGAVVSILESMAFTEDEDVDESVSRYMQHLLARSPQPQEGERDRHSSSPPQKRSTVAAATGSNPSSKNATVDGLSSAAPTAVSGNPSTDSQLAPEDLSESEDAPARLQPVHNQDRDAVRVATEQMRQVANQQTVKNVEAANWKQIRQSIKLKLVLATLAFMLSAGLLFWGYYYRPEFLVLGVLTSGLGIVTWLDLLVAIRQAHVRASKLTGRKKPTDAAKS